MTSRQPGDLPAFNEAMLELFRHSYAESRGAGKRAGRPTEEGARP